MLTSYAVSPLFSSPVPPSPFDIKCSVFLQILAHSIVLGLALFISRDSFKKKLLFSIRKNYALDSVIFYLPLSYLR